jgi:hypothetical protein
MIPRATVPKQSPKPLGETPSTPISTKDEPEMNANWPPNIRALTST